MIVKKLGTDTPSIVTEAAGGYIGELGLGGEGAPRY